MPPSRAGTVPPTHPYWKDMYEQAVQDFQEEAKGYEAEIQRWRDRALRAEKAIIDWGQKEKEKRRNGLR